MGDLLELPMSHVVNLFEKLAHLKVSAGHLERIRCDAAYRERVSETIIELDKEMAGEEHKVTVDHSLSFNEMMIKCLGETGVYHRDIPKAHFPKAAQEGEVVKTLVLVNPCRRLTIYEGFDELSRRGLKPATWEDAFSFGFRYDTSSIVPLGSRWKNPVDEREYVLTLGRTMSGNHHLWMESIRHYYEGLYLFLGVK